jgi:hypothetical protein
MPSRLLLLAVAGSIPFTVAEFGRLPEEDWSKL